MDEHRRSLLVVEDDEATRRVPGSTTCAPTASGWRARAGWARACERSRCASPTLVLLDLMLDGRQRARAARPRALGDGLASRIDPELPVIVLSGRGAETPTACAASRAAPTTTVQALLVRRAAGARPRGAAARGGPRGARGVLRVGELTRRPDHARGAPGRASRCSCRRRSSRCCTRWPRIPRACTGSSELLRDVWGYLSHGRHAHARRARLPPAQEAEPVAAPWVVNVRGVGYRLTEAL